MSTIASQIAAQLGELKASYARTLPDKVRAIEEALDRMFRAPEDPGAARTAFRLVHTLAGTSGTYGFSLVCQAAADLKSLLRPVGEGAGPVTEALRPRVALLMGLLRRALDS
jgi:chemotaxis protein histidine kinase CheA